MFACREAAAGADIQAKTLGLAARPLLHDWLPEAARMLLLLLLLTKALRVLLDLLDEVLVCWEVGIAEVKLHLQTAYRPDEQLLPATIADGGQSIS
jgi:hypothetical protein